MKIKSRVEKMLDHQGTAVAQELYDELVVNTDENGKIEVAKVAEIISKYVKGIKGSTYSEIAYTLLFLGDGKVPTWLGGTELPSTLDTPAVVTTNNTVAVVEPAVVRPAWEAFL